jgi:hypothetical protein
VDKLIDALALVAEGRPAEGMELMAAVGRAAAAAGDTDRALVSAGYRAAIAVRCDPDGALAWLLVERVAAALDTRLRLPAPADSDLRDLAATLAVKIAQRDGDPEMPKRLAELEQTQLAMGYGDIAATTAVYRARLLLDRGRAAEAVEAVLPGLLALDAGRFELPDAARRTRNEAMVVAGGYDTAFRAAAACGNHLVVAELIEIARGNPIPRPRSPDDRNDAMSALTGLPGADVQPHRTALPPPPFLRTPWGTRALAEYLRRAERYAPGRRRDAAEVEWRIGGCAGSC